MVVFPVERLEIWLTLKTIGCTLPEMARFAKFATAVKKHGGRRAVSALLMCSYEFVRRLEAGEKTPGLALALKIEEVLCIPVAYWKYRPATPHEAGRP
jgi:hypothetical protein